MRGGLAGCAGTSAKIENCYALGDVLVDDPYGTSPNTTFGDVAAVSAGGLAGVLDVGSTGVYYSFATGSVTVQTDTLFTNSSYAGGLVGYRKDGAIERCAALGETLTIKGAAVGVARIYGYPSTKIGVANYAMWDMYLEIWDAYRNGDLTDSGTTYGAEADTSGPVGMSIESGTSTDSDKHLGEVRFWTNRIGFSGSIWNMSGVARGYPKLANVGGQ
jgi:hypothetical protein